MNSSTNFSKERIQKMRWKHCVQSSMNNPVEIIPEIARNLFGVGAKSFPKKCNWLYTTSVVLNNMLLLGNSSTNFSKERIQKMWWQYCVQSSMNNPVENCSKIARNLFGVGAKSFPKKCNWLYTTSVFLNNMLLLGNSSTNFSKERIQKMWWKYCVQSSMNNPVEMIPEICSVLVLISC